MRGCWRGWRELLGLEGRRRREGTGVVKGREGEGGPRGVTELVRLGNIRGLGRGEAGNVTNLKTEEEEKECNWGGRREGRWAFCIVTPT